MNPRNTVLVLLVLAALGAYVYWVELPSDERKAAEERLLAVEEDAVTGIALTYPDRTLALVRDDDAWRLTEPVEAPADAGAVKNLVHALTSAKITRTLEDVEDKLGSYGLDEPSVVVEVTTSDGASPPAIKVGESTAVSAASYVQRDDPSVVHIATDTFRSAMLRTMKDLREKRVFQFEDQDVRRVELTRNGQTVAIVRADANADWQITAPAAYLADGAEMRALLASARGLRATNFPTDDPDANLTPYGLDAPRLSLGIATADDATLRTLHLGGDHPDPEKKEIFAKRDDGPTVYTIAQFALKNLGKTLMTLRDKTIVRYDADEAAAIEVTRTDGAGFTLTKSEDGWHVEGGGAGAERAPTISRFVDDVHGFKGNIIVGQGDVDLAFFGLDQPAVTITVRNAAGNTLGTLLATETKGEGKEEAGFAAAAGGDIVYGMKPYVLERIHKTAADFREAAPADSAE